MEVKVEESTQTGRKGVEEILSVKPRHKGPGGGGGPKPKPKMTINELATIVEKLAVEMRAGFAQSNKRFDNLEQRFDNLVKVNNLKE